VIVDAFTYYNETDVLRIRLEELGDVVDEFVVVEADQTFTGLPKPFYFDDLPNWVDKWRHKILRYQISFPSQDMTPWEREYYQRNAIRSAVEWAPSDATILISDADEIVSPTVLGAKRWLQNFPVRIDNVQYFWNLNWQVPKHCNQGARPVAVLNGDLQNGPSPQELRAANLPIVGHNIGGWHFSFLGDQERARKKIESFAHTEMNTEEFKAASHMHRCAKNGIDPFDRFPLRYTPINYFYPRWVQENQDQLQHLIISPPYS
jgi:beta-1,4-mannosyl-glycoprotein beta-1,4-N-acetylglucosaminyltransferase